MRISDWSSDVCSSDLLGAGRREAVAEAVELLGIDGVQAKAPRHQAFHHRSMRCLDRHRYFLRPRARDREDPLRHGGQAGAVVREAARSQPDTRRVAHMALMILRAPIDTREPPLLMFHAPPLSCPGPCHGPHALLYLLWKYVM